MNRRCYMLCSLATGFFLVTVWVLLGFWGRWICWDVLIDLSSGRRTSVTISPSRLLPDEIEYDPNVVTHSKVDLQMYNPSPHVSGLGITHDTEQILRRQGAIEILRWERQVDGTWTYLDRARGRIVHSYVEKKSKHSPPERTWVYVGPKGVAESSADAIGRFQDPMVGHTPVGLIVFDSKLQRFFRIVLSDPHRGVIEGPALDRKVPYRPVQILNIDKGCRHVHLQAEPPMREIDPNEPRGAAGTRTRYRKSDTVPVVPLATGSWLDSCILVLDSSGRIDKLDLDTLQLAGSAGALPEVWELFARPTPRPRPRDLAAYSILPIHMFEEFTSTESQSLGCAAFATNRDGSATTLVVYDKDGRQKASSMVWSVKTDVPGAALVTTLRFCLENLHPPALSVLSFFTASQYDGGAGYRSIFTLPDSFIAKKSRDHRGLYVFRLMEGLAIIAPSIVLAVVLACLLARRTRRMGLSNDARLFWGIATTAFGVPAYLTYRLTEPRERLVTCPNCGKLRRPDMDRCHHCQSPWDVPELVAPAWRVLDGAQESATDILSESPEPQSSEPESSASDSSAEEESK